MHTPVEIYCFYLQTHRVADMHGEACQTQNYIDLESGSAQEVSRHKASQAHHSSHQAAASKAAAPMLMVQGVFQNIRSMACICIKLFSAPRPAELRHPLPPDAPPGQAVSCAVSAATTSLAPQREHTHTMSHSGKPTSFAQCRQHITHFA